MIHFNTLQPCPDRLHDNSQCFSENEANSDDFNTSFPKLPLQLAEQK